MVEMLLAAPVLCLLALGAMQVALLMHARDALAFAALEAARAGSVGHALPEAVEAGLARGLLPLLRTLPADGDRAALDSRASVHLRQAIAAGELRWRQLSPTRESFTDWGEPARDASGAPIDGIEIPVDHLPTEARRRQPASGAAGARAGAPIGRASGQTLADATLLRIEIVYGVPVTVPLAGALIARSLAVIDGCSAPSARPMGAIDLGTTTMSAVAGTQQGAQQGAQTRAWNCALYAGGESPGAREPRIPIRVSSIVRMQSAVRAAGNLPTRVAVAVGRGAPSPPEALPSESAQAPAGSVSSGQDPASMSGESRVSPGAGDGRRAPSPEADPPSGFLQFGSDRQLPDIGACTAPESGTGSAAAAPARGPVSRPAGGSPWPPSGARGAG